MKNRINVSQRAIVSYCSIIKEATRLGVPLDDILSETRNYHGEVFTEAVRHRLGNM